MADRTGYQVIGLLVVLSGLHCIAMWLVFVPAAGKVWTTKSMQESHTRYQALIAGGALSVDESKVQDMLPDRIQPLQHLMEPLLANGESTSMQLAVQVAIQGGVLVVLGLMLILARPRMDAGKSRLDRLADEALDDVRQGRTTDL